MTRTTKQAAKNTRRLWGRPKWRGREISAGTFFFLTICLTAALVAAYYLYKQAKLGMI